MSSLQTILFKEKSNGKLTDDQNELDDRYDSEDDQEEEEEEEEDRFDEGPSDEEGLRDHAMDTDALFTHTNQGTLDKSIQSTSRLEMESRREEKEDHFLPRFTTSSSSSSSSQRTASTARDEVLANMFNMSLKDIKSLKKRAEEEKDTAEFALFMSIKNNAGLL